MISRMINFCATNYIILLYIPQHNEIKIDSSLKTADWTRYTESSWIYKGFMERFEEWFADDNLHPWVIERHKSHEVHLSGYIDEPTFGG